MILQVQKGEKMRRILLAASVLVFFLVGLAFAPTDPIPHMINYQGMLTDDGGIPLNGSYDLTFSIYSISSGGSALWHETHNDVLVDNGLFSVILGSTTSIPSSVFEGAERYLGIKVDADPELTPRIQLTSVGYAYMAETAISDGDWTVSGDNIYSSVSGNVGIGAAPPTEKLDVAGTVKMSGFMMAPSASAGYVLTSDGSGVGTWQEAPGGEIDGSGGANYIPKFTSGTTIGNSVMYQSGNNIGIGTTGPTAPLTIYPVSGYDILFTGGGNNADIMSDRQFNLGTTNSGVFSILTNGLTRLRAEGDGDIGIGTTSPDAVLDVYGTRNISGSSDGIVNIGNSSGNHVTLDNNEIHGRNGSSAADLYINDFGGDVMIAGQGNVGIGVINPSEKLHVRGTLTKTVIDGSTFGMLVLGDYNDAADAKYFHIRSDGSTLTMGKINDAFNTYSYSIAVTRDGDVGIGLSNPTGKLHVTDNTTQRTLNVTNSYSGSVLQVINFERSQNVPSNNDILQIVVPSGSNDAMQFIECERGSDVEFKVNGNGDVYADGSWHTPATDFAEMIEVGAGASTAEPGDVMVIDPHNTRSVLKSSGSRSTLVAGIYSTKPGFVASPREWDKPSAGDEESETYSMKDMAAEFNEIPLALVGIVPCKVSAENGAINPGDLLVTSSTPGHAMRDDDPKVGTVVGKALGSLSSGTGIIQVLVMLQ